MQNKRIIDRIEEDGIKGSKKQIIVNKQAISEVKYSRWGEESAPARLTDYFEEIKWVIILKIEIMSWEGVDFDRKCKGGEE